MRRKGKYLLVIIYIFFQLVLFVISDLSMYMKIILMVFGVAFGVSLIQKKYFEKILLINILCWALIGGCITFKDLWKYGSQVKLATAQTVYRLADYHDPILPLVLRDKTVHIRERDFFINYVELFSDNIVTYENLPYVEIEDSLYEKIAYIGPLTNDLYYQYEPKKDFFDEKIKQSFQEANINPLLYVCVEGIEDEDIYWLRDESYNVYIVGKSMYENIVGEFE